MDSRYLITDYERANFSLSECKFEDNYAQDLISIASTTRTPSHRSRPLTIGTSVGAASLIILITITILFAIRKRRRNQNKKAEPTDPSPETRASQEKPRATTVCSIREIHQNSLCGPIRELPDNGMAELLDDKFPSGSGNQIAEMTPSRIFVAHELGTSRSSKEQLVVQTNFQKKSKSLQSPSSSVKSSTTFESFDGDHFIERQISNEAGLSTPASTISPEISPSSMWKDLNLNRSLPPTPISESPQMSPNSFRYREEMPSPQYSLKSTSPTSMFSATHAPRKALASKFSNASTRPRCHPGGYSLKGLEKTIPPDRSNSDASDVSTISNKEPIINTTWL